jgi:hypothetical protein
MYVGLKSFGQFFNSEKLSVLKVEDWYKTKLNSLNKFCFRTNYTKFNLDSIIWFEEEKICWRNDEVTKKQARGKKKHFHMHHTLRDNGKFNFIFCIT